MKTKSTEKTNQASSIPVHCAHARLADVTTLVANPRNPNKHSDAQVAMLAKIIRHQGWRSPITVSKRSGFIVSGHGRLQAAKLLQVDQVPVDEQDFATEADEWAHLVADNKIAELAEMDGAILNGIFGDLDTGAFDMNLTGFDAEEMERLTNSFEDPTVLKPLKIQEPPKMAWVLIGIPVVSYGNIQRAVEALSKIPDVICEQTVSNE